MTENLPPTVLLDGTAVRRIREEKKLTQLYVAKVVGVTTDTISRWENNRYPSIKKENALKLADALEVEVGELLQQDERSGGEAAAENPAVPSPATRRSRLLWFLAGLAVAAAGLLAVYQQQEVIEADLPAHRLLPNFAAPGGLVPVRVRLEPAPEVSGFILREHFPEGWKLIEANPPASSLNNEEGTARWIVKPDEQRQRIVYLLRVSAEAALGDEGRFEGEIVANPDGGSDPVSVLGDSRVEVGPYLWADKNGDQRVDDSEMLSASDTFDEMKGVHLDWDQLEAIWDAEGYRWRPRNQDFIAEHPEPSAR